jgi:tetratricopeptide (TPR) repeat protein
VDAHLILGWDLMKQGEFDKALKHMKMAGDFPSNMMVAKPYRGGRSAEVHYFTGKVYEAMGEKELASESYASCVAERQNLQLDENYYYLACGLKGTGNQQEAEKILNRLIELGERRLHSTQADFFAKFGERETPEDKLSNAYYLMGLGYMGKGMEEEAGEMFSEAVKLNINHVWAARYLSEMQQ